MKTLHEIKSVGKLSPIEQACQDGLALAENRNAEVQQKRIKAAQAEVVKLAELGYEVEAIPDNVSQFRVNALEMSRLVIEKDFTNLQPKLSEALRARWIVSPVAPSHQKK